MCRVRSTSQDMAASDFFPQIASMGELMEYVDTCSPAALCHSNFEKDFHLPASQGHVEDGTAYTKDGLNPFETVIFGRIRNPVRLRDFHRTFRIDCDEAAPKDVRDAFVDQLTHFGAAVSKDNDVNNNSGEGILVYSCTDSDRSTGSGGTYLEVHVDLLNTKRCHFYEMQDGERQVRIPTQWPFKKGDWVVFRATLHRYTNSLISSLIVRQEYYVLATHLCVVDVSGYDVIAAYAEEMDRARLAAEPKDPHPSSVDSGHIGVRTRSQKRKEASAGSTSEGNPDVRTPPKKKACAPDGPPSVPDTRGSAASSSHATPTRRPRMTARISTGGKPPNHVHTQKTVPIYFHYDRPNSYITLPCSNASMTAHYLLVGSAPEVLDDIFKQLITPTDDTWLLHWKAKKRLCLVCKYWRDVIYGVARYWARISIHRFTRASYIRFCLERAKLLDLTILIFTYPSSEVIANGFRKAVHSKDIGHQTAIVRDLVGPVSPRIARLYVGCTEYGDWEAVAQCISAFSFPILERSYLEGAVSDGAGKITFVAVAPCVNQGAYSTLTSLTLRQLWRESCIEWSLVHAALSSAPLLETLAIEEVECTGIDSARTVTFLHLTQLSLACGNGATFNIFAQIAAPALNYSRINLWGEASLNDFARVCANSIAHASRLNICLDFASTDQMVSLFAALPTAVEYDFRRCTVAVIEVLRDVCAIRGLRGIRKVKVLEQLDFEDASTFLTTMNETRTVKHAIVQGGAGVDSMVHGQYMEWTFEGDVLVCRDIEDEWSEDDHEDY
ncbi:hypothetical protein DFH09DRAFT_1067898 [Mycena vulgaris]|nr:hypothetical protein DFH09DRAFT_1067898 [Mycena vulgaris]